MVVDAVLRVRGDRRRADVVRAGLRVMNLDDPVPVVVEDPRVHEFVLGLGAATRPVHGYKVVIRKGLLRVVIPPPVPGMAWHRVQVPPVLLHVLAVVALLTGQAERPLLEDRVVSVPQGQRQAQPLFDVAEPGQPVLAPPVDAGPGVVVGQVVPGLAVRAVVLPDRAPLPLADVRPPTGTSRRPGAARPPGDRIPPRDPAQLPRAGSYCAAALSIRRAATPRPSAARADGGLDSGCREVARSGQADRRNPCRGGTVDDRAEG